MADDDLDPAREERDLAQVEVGRRLLFGGDARGAVPVLRALVDARDGRSLVSAAAAELLVIAALSADMIDDAMAVVKNATPAIGQAAKHHKAGTIPDAVYAAVVEQMIAAQATLAAALVEKGRKPLAANVYASLERTLRALGNVDGAAQIARERNERCR